MNLSSVIERSEDTTLKTFDFVLHVSLDFFVKNFSLTQIQLLDRLEVKLIESKAEIPKCTGIESLPSRFNVTRTNICTITFSKI